MISSSGSYAGSAGTVTVSMSFDPDVIIIKARAVQSAQLWISGMANAEHKSISAVTIATSGGPTLSGSGTGFTIAAGDATTNVSGTTYDWLAFQDNGAGDFGTFTYSNNNTDNRDINVGGLAGVTPDYALVCSRRNLHPVERFKCEVGDVSVSLAGSETETADWIQALQLGGIQVGNAVEVNGVTATTFYGFAIKNSALFYAFAASYTGTGSGHNVTDAGAGFTPDHGWVKALLGSNQAHTQRHASETAGNSASLGSAAEIANGITAMVANGITLGTANLVNGNTFTYTAALLKNGTTSPPAGQPMNLRRNAAPTQPMFGRRT